MEAWWIADTSMADADAHEALLYRRRKGKRLSSGIWPTAPGREWPGRSHIYRLGTCHGAQATSEGGSRKNTERVAQSEMDIFPAATALGGVVIRAQFGNHGQVTLHYDASQSYNEKEEPQRPFLL